ncbi:cytochrome c-type biogenesis protein [Roseomonas sp. CCTCC AB2023176]|uniref:cytochrome c-type biogenesis protein n=1 Tax=Roseomonas sp. CCTCC AB2023176 TaxID=3342640 RepID=UPI0035D84491
MIRALVLLLALAAPALAPPAGAAVGDPREQLRDPAQEERAREIGRELRCLVCQNQSIEDSDADLARDLRRIVREKVAAGEPSDAVREFVHARYGDFVLLRPPVNAATIALWATPFLALGGGIVAILLSRRRGAPQPAAPLSPEERARLATLEDRPAA